MKVPCQSLFFPSPRAPYSLLFTCPANGYHIAPTAIAVFQRTLSTTLIEISSLLPGTDASIQRDPQHTPGTMSCGFCAALSGRPPVLPGRSATTSGSCCSDGISRRSEAAPVCRGCSTRVVIVSHDQYAAQTAQCAPLPTSCVSLPGRTQAGHRMKVWMQCTVPLRVTGASSGVLTARTSASVIRLRCRPGAVDADVCTSICLGEVAEADASVCEEMP